MAAKTTTRTAAKDAEKATGETNAPQASGLGFSLNVTRGEITRVAPKREKEPNPTEEAVKHSRETGDVLAFEGLPNEEAVKKVTGFLRRAASEADHGIQIQAVQIGDTWTINFKATEKKRDRAYTADDIREFGNANGMPCEPKQKISAELRDAFKKALKDAGNDLDALKKTYAK